MCSYLASFPASLAHAFIARYSRPGDVVLDPFSGRGTAPLQALAEGRIGVGNDLNPLAQVLTAAKVEPATPAEARTRLAALRLAWNADAAAWLALGERVVARPGHPSAYVPAAGSGGGPESRAEAVPDEVALAFHPRTLGQLLLVRSQLRLDDRTDRFLAGALAGILHGKTPSYLSTIMPNTFSMAPRYVRDFVARTGLRAAREGRLRRPVGQAGPPLPPAAPGTRGHRARRATRARPGGARGRPFAPAACPDRARLVVTSPPYLRVLKYGYYNWLRTWVLGFDARAIDEQLDDAHHREPWIAFMRDVLVDLRPALTDDGIAVLVIGDVEMDRGKPSAAGPCARRACLGGGGLPRRVPARRPRPRRGRGEPQDDPPVGRGGGPGDEDGPDPRPRRDRGRPPPRARRRGPAARLEPGRRRGLRPL